MHRDPPVGELADAATLALLLALGDLPPHERLAFILQRVFGLPDHEVAALLRSGGPPRAGDAPSPPRARP
jgi:DNA-directed RNA polymerase specialized sigma24 family protein